jgi:hypothetical protein
MAVTIDWNEELAEQLDWHWRANLRPRLEGLTNEEYFWEPVPGMWSVRPRSTSLAPVPLGGGEYTYDWGWSPDPAPATTIAWRLSHLIVGVFGRRAAAHFGAPQVDFETYQYPGDAATALARLDDVYNAWTDGVRKLDAAALARRCGPAEGAWADSPMATLVLHINREALHHGAEIALLRDLYRWQSQLAAGAVAGAVTRAARPGARSGRTGARRTW